MPKYSDEYDGLLLFGGVDMHPRCYRRQIDGSVNSAHHQSINRLGAGLRLTQVSDADGVIEGFEHESLPIIGVQWHPERTALTRARPDTVNGGALFDYFINLCNGVK